MDRMKERKKEERGRKLAVRKQKLLQYKRVIRNKLPLLSRYLLILILITSFYYIVVGTNLFTIDNVKIDAISANGFRYTNRDEVGTSAENMVNGVNFFVLNPNGVRKELLKEYPYIKEIYTEKRFPNLLELKVSEKSVLFLVEFGNECLPIDEFGGIITAIDKESNCMELVDLQHAIYINVSDEAYDSIRSQRGFFIFDQLSQLRGLMKDLGYDISSISVIERKIVITNSKSQRFIFDPFENFNTQLKRAALVLSDIDSHDQFTELDFRFIRPVSR